MSKSTMRYISLLAAALLLIHIFAQTTTVSTPEYIVVDSKDNIFVTRHYGMLKIAPDGTVTDLSKQGPAIGGMDQTWTNLIIDSKDNLYATVQGGTTIYNIYKITVSADNKAAVSLFAGQHRRLRLSNFRAHTSK